jgi:hypothetical protein
MTAKTLGHLPQEELEFKKLRMEACRERSPQGAEEMRHVDEIARLRWLIDRGDQFALETDKFIARTLSVDELFEPTRDTLEAYEKVWHFRMCHAAYREKLVKQRIAAELQLDRLQARRREMAATRRISHEGGANGEAAGDTPAEPPGEAGPRRG